MPWGHFKRFSRSHSRHTVLQNDNCPVVELLRQFFESWSGNLSIFGVMLSTIDWNLMAFWANLCVLGSKVEKITLMKGMQNPSAQSCQLWKFTNMWINILGFLILTYTSAYITFLINKTFHIKQFCITTRDVCSCDVHYLVSEKFLSYLLFTCLFSLLVFHQKHYVFVLQVHTKLGFQNSLLVGYAHRVIQKWATYTKMNTQLLFWSNIVPTYYLFKEYLISAACSAMRREWATFLSVCLWTEP